jgi:flagellar biosynthesis protein FlhG
MGTTTTATILPVAGGKGGAGKSFITASLGAFLAKQQKSVILIDLDLGAANLHTLLGLKPPARGLHELLRKKITDLHDVMVPTVIPNLHLISSCQCSMEVANLYHQQKLKIISSVQRLEADYVLLDLGAGTNFNTLDFFLAGRQGVLVLTPEPTSIENTIRFIRSVYIRRLKQLVKKHKFHAIVGESVDLAQRGIINSPDVIEAALQYDPDKKAMLKEELAGLEFRMILNQFRKVNDAGLGEKLQTVFNRHFYSHFDYVGMINYDDRVHDSISAKNLYVHKYPYTMAAVDLRNIANDLLTRMEGTTAN